MTRSISHRLINHLRHAGTPLHPQRLAALYERREELDQDLGLLASRGLVDLGQKGIVWKGS